MRLAVFTSRYPARIATFFERDMRSLVEAGVELDVFVIGPLDTSQWQHSLELLGPRHLPRNRVHHLTLGQALRTALPMLRAKFATCRSDAAAVLPAAARHGGVAFAKTAYVLPKAWAWAKEYGDRYDHILAYWGNYAGTCAYAFHRATGSTVPFSIWMHAGVDLYFRPVFVREKLAYADNIITCCEFNQAYIAQQFGNGPGGIAGKVHVCHHGLDLTGFPYRADGRPSDRVLAVGRLAKHKGFDFLLRAVRQLVGRGGNVHLELIGGGAQQQTLRALARQLGISDRVSFRGWVSFAEVQRAMSNATVLVHPSDGLGDGLPNVVREAMALGTPVIASNVAGIPEALRDDCGVLVPPRDVSALAAALEQVLADPARRQRVAARARARVEERYDLWRNGARLAELLRATRRDRVPVPLC